MSRETTPSAERKQSVARNPKATHDYHVLETWETGIVLTGTEVKSLRNGKASIKEAYARVRNGEVFLEGMNITPYEQGNRYNHDPVRTRKLLLHRREIEKLIGAVEQRGLTLVPLELYFKNGRAKVALALGKGKKQHDKRETIKRKSRGAGSRAGRLHPGAAVISFFAFSAALAGLGSAPGCLRWPASKASRAFRSAPMKPGRRSSPPRMLMLALDGTARLDDGWAEVTVAQPGVRFLVGAPLYMFGDQLQPLASVGFGQ